MKSSIRECGVCATVIPVKDPDICSLSQKKLCDLNISCSTRDMQCSPFVSSYWRKKLIKSISQGIYFETRIKVTSLSVANPSVKFFSFSCSFRKTFCKIIDLSSRTSLGSWRPWEILDPPLPIVAHFQQRVFFCNCD